MKHDIYEQITRHDTQDWNFVEQIFNKIVQSISRLNNPRQFTVTRDLINETSDPLIEVVHVLYQKQITLMDPCSFSSMLHSY